MSNKQNDGWIEAAHENFQQAIADGNFSLAQDVIEDTRNAGFSEAAEKMQSTYKELPSTRVTE